MEALADGPSFIVRMSPVKTGTYFGCLMEGPVLEVLVEGCATYEGSNEFETRGTSTV